MSRRGRARLSAARELLDRGQLAEAKALAEECLRERPEDFDALHLLGVVAARQGDLVAGATWLERAVAANPGAAQAWHNLGLTREKAGLGDAAIAAYRSAVEADRTFAPAHIGLANQLIARRRFPEAAEGLKAVLSLRPDDLRSASTHACLRRIMCDWEEIDRLEGELVAAVAAGRAGVLPFPFLAMTDDPALQLACARRSAAAKSVPVEAPRRPAGGRIRLGYLSADFRDHATSFLMAELFELHDRARFEVVGFSYGPRERSPMRRRLEGAFDRFVDIADASDEAAALRIRAAEIDIAIDLKGLTQDGRLGILSAHPAPVQVHYIGYPGTTGVDFIDYLIADAFVVPPDRQDCFTENVVYLPESYQINDRRRAAAPRRPTRTEQGLPDDAFVFASFNATYKIAPAMFDVWVRLVKAVPHAVLWLFADNPWAAANLRREAETRGLDPARLIVAGHAALADHLARQPLADLFLDTVPVNAHTTASDALWMGLPVLTCAGRSFAARVAGSLLHAVGLPELVTENLDDYERLALRLATSPGELATLRAKLARNLPDAPLFDAARTTRHIERAYERMWEIYRRGEALRSLTVDPLPS